MFLNTGLTKLRLKLNSTNYFCKLGSRREREEKKRKGGEKKEKKEACKSKIFKSQKKRSRGGLFFLKIKDLMRYS